MDGSVVPFSQWDIGGVEIVIDSVEQEAELQRVAAANPIDVVRRLVGGEMEIVRARRAKTTCRGQVAGGKNSHGEARYKPKLCIRNQRSEGENVLGIRGQSAAPPDARGV